MSGKRRTLWRGSVEVTEEEELDIAITTHLPSQRGQETFDWKVKNDEVGGSCLLEQFWTKKYISGEFASFAKKLSLKAK